MRSSAARVRWQAALNATQVSSPFTAAKVAAPQFDSPHADDHQTLPAAGCRDVIENTNPIVGPRRRALSEIPSHALSPQPHGRRVVAGWGE